MEFEGALKEVNATVVYGDCRTPDDVITKGFDAVCIITEHIPLGEPVFKACPELKPVFTNNVGTV